MFQKSHISSILDFGLKSNLVKRALSRSFGLYISSRAAVVRNRTRHNSKPSPATM